MLESFETYPGANLAKVKLYNLRNIFVNYLFPVQHSLRYLYIHEKYFTALSVVVALVSSA